MGAPGHRCGVLTSAWHLPRAMAQARRLRLECTPLPADFRGNVPPPTLFHLIPQGEGFEDVHSACWEYLGRWLGH